MLLVYGLDPNILLGVFLVHLQPPIAGEGWGAGDWFLAATSINLSASIKVGGGEIGWQPSSWSLA